MNERIEKNTRATIDPALIARARAGEQAALAELYRQTSPALYRSIRSMVRDEDQAWDILQDSYLRAFQNLDKLESNEAFLSWLRRIAVNEAVSQMKRRQPVLFTDLSGEDAETYYETPDLSIGSQPELTLDRKETVRLVREILAELPEQQQLVVGMRYYEDMSIREIAETLNVAPGTVKAQLFQGRKRVETRVRALEKQGVKLYGMAPLPFLVALLRKLEPAQAAGQKTLAAVLSRAPAAGAATAGAAGAASGTAGAASGTVAASAAAGLSGGAVNMTAMTAGQAFLHGFGVKLLAGVLTVLLIGGGLWAGRGLLKDHQPSPEDTQVLTTEALPIPTRPETEQIPDPSTPVAPTEPREGPVPTLETRLTADPMIRGPAGDISALYFSKVFGDPVYGDVDGDGQTELVYNSSETNEGKIYDAIFVYGLEDGWPIQKGWTRFIIGDATCKLVQEGGQVYYSYQNEALGYEEPVLLPVVAEDYVVHLNGDDLPEGLEISYAKLLVTGISWRELKEMIGDRALASEKNYLIWKEPGTFSSEEDMGDEEATFVAVTKNGATVWGRIGWWTLPDGTYYSSSNCTVDSVETVMGKTESELRHLYDWPHFELLRSESGFAALCWFTTNGKLLTVQIDQTVVSATLTDLPIEDVP